MRIRHLLWAAAGAAVLCVPAIASAQPACGPESVDLARHHRGDARCADHRFWIRDHAGYYVGEGGFVPVSSREYGALRVPGGHWDANGVWADGDPLGYWDASGVFHPGNIEGYFDARGRWIPGSDPAPGA
jgi:hypothetical protein